MKLLSPPRRILHSQIKVYVVLFFTAAPKIVHSRIEFFSSPPKLVHPRISVNIRFLAVVSSSGPIREELSSSLNRLTKPLGLDGARSRMTRDIGAPPTGKNEKRLSDGSSERDVSAPRTDGVLAIHRICKVQWYARIPGLHGAKVSDD